MHVHRKQTATPIALQHEEQGVGENEYALHLNHPADFTSQSQTFSTVNSNNLP
jgi:hypothetical protein